MNKKIVYITIISLIFSLFAFGQSWKETRAAEYGAEARKEFKLNDQQTAEIEKLFIARLDAFSKVGNDFKSGVIDKDKQKEENLRVGQTYTAQMSKILGISPIEFRKFNKETMEKIKGD